MPLPELTKTITLEKVGAPEFEVTFTRIPGMKYGEMLEIFKTEDKLSPRERVKTRFKQLIVGWTEMERSSLYLLTSLMLYLKSLQLMQSLSRLRC